MYPFYLGIDLHLKRTFMVLMNADGLVRQYFTKGINFFELTEQDIERVMLRLNQRPKKCLDFSSPNMIFFQEMGVALKT